VNDIILQGNSISEIKEVTQLLDKTFKVKDLEDLNFFIRLEVANQGRYTCFTTKICSRHVSDVGVLAGKPCSTPMVKNMKNMFNVGSSLEDITFCQRLVGRLIYLTNTRPDISYVVQFLSHFMHAPTLEHHAATHRVLRYIKGAPVCSFPATPTYNRRAFVVRIGQPALKLEYLQMDFMCFLVHL